MATAAEYCEQGQKSLDAGKYVEAMEYFQAAIEADKHFEKAYILLATAYEKQGKKDKAKAALYGLLAIDPNNEKAMRVVQGISSLEEIRLQNTQQTAMQNQVLLNTRTSNSTSTISLTSSSVPIGHQSTSTDYDFYIDYEKNRLYLKIIGTHVEVVAPNGKINNIFYHRWDGYKMPEGDLIIPSAVSFQSQQYIVSSVGEEAFKQCDSLQSVVIQSPVSVIKKSAFENCSKLRSVTLPASLITIGISAFASCALTSICIPSNVKTIETEAFKSSKIKHLVIPDGMGIIDASIVKNCSFLETITIPSSVTRLIGYWGGKFTYDSFIMIMKGYPPAVSSMADGIKVEVPDGLIEEYRNAKYWQRCKLVEKQERLKQELDRQEKERQERKRERNRKFLLWFVVLLGIAIVIGLDVILICDDDFTDINRWGTLLFLLDLIIIWIIGKLLELLGLW